MLRLRRLISRRALMALLTRSVFGLSALTLIPRYLRAAGPAGKETIPDPGTDVLAVMIRELYPHAQLDDGSYRDMARAVRERASEVAAERLQAGMVELDKRAGGGWVGADRETRLAVLKGIENEPFSQDVHGAAAELIYRDPRVWQLIGYGGNALAKGGYLHRGFNDIGWLPGTTAP